MSSYTAWPRPWVWAQHYKENIHIPMRAREAFYCSYPHQPAPNPCYKPFEIHWLLQVLFQGRKKFPGLWITSLSVILLIFISLQSNFDVNSCHLPFHKHVKCPSFEVQWHPKETLLQQLITNCIPLQFAFILHICLPCCATVRTLKVRVIFIYTFL